MNQEVKVSIQNDRSYILSNGRIINLALQTDNRFYGWYQSKWIGISLDVNGVVVISESNDINVGDFIVSEIDLTEIPKSLRVVKGDFHFNAETVNKIVVARRAEIRLAEKEARDLEHFWDDAKRKAARNPVYRPDPPTKKVNHTDELIHDGDFYWY